MSKAYRGPQADKLESEFLPAPLDFRKEINYIAEILDIDVKRIRICEDHPCGEHVIFIDGFYNGYLDNDFYNFMESGIDHYRDYEGWIDRWRNK